jgi:hypothetical protein
MVTYLFKKRWYEINYLFQGGYMAAKKAKLHEQFSEDAAKEGCSHSNTGSSIFQGVAIFVNGYTGMHCFASC